MIPSPYRYIETYIVLELEPQLFTFFPDSINWQGDELTKKDEFHVTICRGKAVFSEVAKVGMEQSEAEKRLLELFTSFVARNPIKLTSLLNDFRYMIDNERGRKSIVVRCVVSNLSEFFAGLNGLFKINMPLQPAHITLYTLQKDLGIHIPTEAVMENLAQVQLPELETALEKSLRKFE